MANLTKPADVDEASGVDVQADVAPDDMVGNLVEAEPVDDMAGNRAEADVAPDDMVGNRVEAEPVDGDGLAAWAVVDDDDEVGNLRPQPDRRRPSRFEFIRAMGWLRPQSDEAFLAGKILESPTRIPAAGDGEVRFSEVQVLVQVGTTGDGKTPRRFRIAAPLASIDIGGVTTVCGLGLTLERMAVGDTLQCVGRVVGAPLRLVVTRMRPAAPDIYMDARLTIPDSLLSRFYTGRTDRQEVGIDTPAGHLRAELPEGTLVAPGTMIRGIGLPSVGGRPVGPALRLAYITLAPGDAEDTPAGRSM